MRKTEQVNRRKTLKINQYHPRGIVENQNMEKKSKGGSNLFRKILKHAAPTRFMPKMRNRKNTIPNF